jgi:hypothetical protein
MLRSALLGLVLAAAHASAQPEPKWSKPLDFLVGDWTGEGSGKPGEGTGSFSFRPELDGTILVRRARSEYPATSGRPASVHEDLMVVYPGSAGIRANYWDNEGHVIQYAVEIASAGDRLVMLSNAAPQTPRFRLTYSRAANDRVKVLFEMAPPGAPDRFSTYIEGTVRRK